MTDWIALVLIVAIAVLLIYGGVTYYRSLHDPWDAWDDDTSDKKD